MANILLVNEYGEGNFHINLLLYASKLLTALGHNCHFGIPILNKSTSSLVSSGYKVFQAPILPPEVNFHQNKKSPSLTDFISKRGFLDVNRMKTITEIWENELKIRKIDLIFTNFAPTILQVARQKIPVINLGTYWDTPSILLKTIPKFNKDSVEDEKILETLVKVFGASRVPNTMPKVLHGDRNLIVTEPEFDYNHPKNAKPRAVGSFEAENVIKHKNFIISKKAFVYLHSYRPNALRILKELAKLNYKIDAYIPKFNSGDKERYKSKNLSFVDKKTYKELQENYALVINHGGLGMGQNMMFLGLNQILIPSHRENLINSSIISGLKFGSTINQQLQKSIDKKQFEKIFDEMFSNKKQEEIWEKTQLFRLRKRPNVKEIIIKLSKTFI